MSTSHNPYILRCVRTNIKLYLSQAETFHYHKLLNIMTSNCCTFSIPLYIYLHKLSPIAMIITSQMIVFLCYMLCTTSNKCAAWVSNQCPHDVGIMVCSNFSSLCGNKITIILNNDHNSLTVRSFAQTDTYFALNKRSYNANFIAFSLYVSHFRIISFCCHYDMGKKGAMKSILCDFGFHGTHTPRHRDPFGAVIERKSNLKNVIIIYSKCCCVRLRSRVYWNNEMENS